MATAPFDGVGNTYGYGVLVEALHRELAAVGVTPDDTAPVALHIEPPINFRKIPGTTAVLYTMWESDQEFPRCFREHLDEADLIIVPCRWNVPIFQAVTQAPILSCPLGVDADTFRFVPRTPPPKGTPFQWLFVGAPNARKGYDTVQDAWREHFYGRPDCHLYFKTSGGTEAAAAMAASEGWTATDDPLVWTRANVTLDMRRLSTADLRQLYADSHGFLYPTGGEGWGLTLHEALATGLPALATDHGGHLDFVSRDTVTLLPWEPVASYLETTVPSASRTDHRLTSAFVHPEDLAREMVATMRHYRAACRQGRRASQHVRQFTWRRTAQRLHRYLQDHATARAA